MYLNYSAWQDDVATKLSGGDIDSIFTSRGRQGKLFILFYLAACKYVTKALVSGGRCNALLKKSFSHSISSVFSIFFLASFPCKDGVIWQGSKGETGNNSVGYNFLVQITLRTKCLFTHSLLQDIFIGVDIVVVFSVVIKNDEMIFWAEVSRKYWSTTIMQSSEQIVFWIEHLYPPGIGRILVLFCWPMAKGALLTQVEHVKSTRTARIASKTYLMVQNPSVLLSPPYFFINPPS